ncbi:ABC transporter permease [Solwaraspora sp. WMMD406]|uniref:ABC transporter permease n=1 Tax=Solwaraspora sp. WMMD406 TaxID=3016095 RepID=UPI0024166DB9|nr:ABC transporter permease [Solwaraspora sp. WMMD406]MDG4764738.1 ABC transporter permease [Solwaraspora sp. WMMD406]
MPAETRTALDETTSTTGDNSGAQVRGLDQLELGPARRRGRPVELAGGLWRSMWPKLLAIALVLAAWQLVFLSGWRPPYALPAPATVLQDLTRLMSTPDFTRAVGITLQRALVGFAVAVAIGTVVGIAVARFAPLRAAIGSLITGLQTMPSIVWFPFAILLFQISETTILFVVVLGAAPSVANGLISGIDYVPRTWLRVGKTLGMRGLVLYRHLILPASLPSFVSGLKQGWAFAWRSLMAGELLVIVAGQGSIGSLMQGAREFNNAPRLLAWIIVILVIGILVDIAFNAVDNALRRRWGLTQS